MRIQPWLVGSVRSCWWDVRPPKRNREQTPAALGEAPAEIMLFNMRTHSVNTFYSAMTPQGRYACAAETGMAKVIALGLTSPPSCYKEATIERGTDTR